jgi:tRNA pseudouridine55 synthase
VALVRRLFHQKRVGHAGTLDPLAEGVLPVLLGRATRLADLVAGGEKVYYADIQLGSVTSTDDLEGETLSTSPVLEFNDAEICAVLDAFVGEIEQVPPIFSAVKLAGQAAYRRARRGEQVAMRPRPVRIEAIHLVRRKHDRLAIVVLCGKGTYIRALARDIGEKLGCGATLARLVRLRVGPFRLEDALTPGEIQRACALDGLAELLLASDAACGQLPALVLDEMAGARAIQGKAWPAEPGDATVARAYTPQGSFLGLAHREPDWDAAVDRTWWRVRVLVDGG